MRRRHHQALPAPRSDQGDQESDWRSVDDNHDAEAKYGVKKRARPRQKKGVRGKGQGVKERARRPRRDVSRAKAGQPLRWNPDPEDVQRSVVKLVLSLIEFIRKLMERQAIRRLEEKTLTPEEIENVGVALMKLEETVRQIAKRFKLDPQDLNLDLGPIGRLH